MPAKFYFWLALILAGPPVAACIALFRLNRAKFSFDDVGPDRQRLGLRLLLMQTFVPPLQVLPLLRSVTRIPSPLENASVLILPVASLLLGFPSLYFLVRYSRGRAQVLLPSLNLLIFTYSTALLLCNLVTP